MEGAAGWLGFKAIVRDKATWACKRLRPYFCWNSHPVKAEGRMLKFKLDQVRAWVQFKGHSGSR